MGYLESQRSFQFLCSVHKSLWERINVTDGKSAVCLGLQCLELSHSHFRKTMYFLFSFLQFRLVFPEMETALEVLRNWLTQLAHIFISLSGYSIVFTKIKLSAVKTP